MSILKIRDENGQVVEILAIRGEDGYTPIKGVDYWTEEDVATIKSYVDEAILGGEW